MHDVHRLLDHPLRAGDLFLEAFDVDCGLHFQCRQLDIDARQGLGNLIMQLAADHLAFFLLGRQKLAGQQPQLFLHVPRLLQQLAVVMLALSEGLLHRFALENLPLQLPVRGDQIHAALVKHLIQLNQLVIVLPGRAMRFLDRGDGLGKEFSRPPDHRFPGAGGVARQHQCDQRLLVKPGQIQRLQPKGHGPASQSLRRPAQRDRLWTLLQVLPQRRDISLRQPVKFASHFKSDFTSDDEY